MSAWLYLAWSSVNAHWQYFVLLFEVLRQPLVKFAEYSGLQSLPPLPPRVGEAVVGRGVVGRGALVVGGRRVVAGGEETSSVDLLVGLCVVFFGVEDPVGPSAWFVLPPRPGKPPPPSLPQAATAKTIVATISPAFNVRIHSPQKSSRS
jgi:hypothetical protein